MIILNATKKTVLAEKAVLADSFALRLRGMIARPFRELDAMYFPRCSSVHTFFMTQKLDLIFLSADNRILKTVSAAAPWIPCFGCSGADSVIELPEGILERTGTRTGDMLDLRAELTEEQQQKWKHLYSKGSAPAMVPFGEK